MMRLLIITSVQQEKRAVQRALAGSSADATIVISGVGRTNAAAATTESIIRHGPFDLVINAGVAGALPGSDLQVGQIIVASSCIYYEEGLVTRGGFSDIEAMGLSLGDFVGNTVPVDEQLVEKCATQYCIGPIATVATCSGTDEAAENVVQRTGALAEAMEGAAVVHAARRSGTRALEVRAISNHAGERSRQQWNLDGALDALGPAMATIAELLA